MSFSNYLEAKLLDHFLKTASFTPPTNIYVGLSTADPGESGSGLAEPDGADGYARKLCNAWDAATGTPTKAANTGAVTFDEATGDWGTITHFALFDASSGGNMLLSAALTTPKDVDTGDVAAFAAGALEVTLD